MKLVLAAVVTALGVGLLAGPLLIPILRKYKFGQTIRSDGPNHHLKKAGTPTLGGIIFLIAFIVSILFWGNGSPALLTVVSAVLLFGLIGFADDSLKIHHHQSLGLTVKQKMFFQFVLSFVLIFIAEKILGRGTELIIPVIGTSLNLGWGYYIFTAVLMVFMVNAVNLTDGLDGLACGISFLVFLGYALICLLAIKNAPVIGIDYLDLAMAAAALAGGCLAFLVFNHYPAKVFMGDTGSLALGGGIMMLAILTKTEIIVLLIGGVYFIEAISVVLQVASFKLRGKRIFLMSPLHHHYEMKGWSENKVVYTFWLAALICVLLGLLFTTF